MNNYLLIGGNSGIGEEVKNLLLSQGNRVYAFSRNIQEESCKNYYSKKLDITTEDPDFGSLPDTLEGIVYFPGTINLKPFRSLKLEDFKKDFDINVLGAIKTIKLNLNRLKKSKGYPAVVMISTVAVQQGMPFHSSVAASKAAIEGLTRSLAAEFAPTIRVNCIAPSLVQTGLAEKLLNSETKIEKSKERHPLKEIGTVGDIAEMITFLLSEKSKWITGQILHIDGGLSSLKVS